MKNLIRFVIIFSILFISQVTTSEMVEILKQKLPRVDTPLSASNYIKDMSAYGNLKIAQFKNDELDSKLDEFGIYGSSREKFKGLLYSKTLLFETFSLTLNMNQLGYLEEIVGIASNLGGVIDLAYMKTYSSGYVIPQLISVPYNYCYKVLFFFTECKWMTRYSPRGFLSEEITILENSLRAKAYNFIQNSLNHYPQSNMLVSRNLIENPDNSTNITDIPIPKSNKEIYEDAISDIVNTFNYTTYISEMVKDYQSTYESILFQEYLDLNSSDLDKLLFEIITSVKSPTAKSKIIDKINKMIETTTVVDPHGLIRISVTNDEENVIFYEIVNHLDETDGLYDIQVRVVFSKIPMNRNLILVRMNNENQLTELNEDISYDGEMTLVMNVFELLILSKIEDYANKNKLIKIPSTASNLLSIDKYQSQTRNAHNPNNIDNLTFLQDCDNNKSAATTPLELLPELFKKVSNVWGTLLGAFHNSRETKIKTTLIGQGFTRYDQSAQIRIIAGLREEGLDTYFNMLIPSLNIPENRREDVKSVLASTQYVETNIWACYDISFSIGTGGMIKYASILSSKGEDNKYYFVVTEIKAELELAPDILVIEEKLSILGGIWERDKIRISEIPKAVVAEDIKTVFEFFQIVVHKRVAAEYGIKLDY